jgi:magnesium transporter
MYSCVKVELGSRAGDLKQMLIDLLDDPHEIRRICIMGRNCTLDRLSDIVECTVPLEKQIAEGTATIYHCNFAYFWRL